jgi:hypothetical protein
MVSLYISRYETRNKNSLVIAYTIHLDQAFLLLLFYMFNTFLMKSNTLSTERGITPGSVSLPKINFVVYCLC